MADPGRATALRSRLACRAGCRRPGFSLIELVVTVGIVMVLLGLALPSLGRARAGARLSQGGVTLRQNHWAVIAYGNDYREVYPIADPFIGPCSLRWWIPLVSGGYLGSERKADPLGVDVLGFVTYALSFCMVYPASEMQRGRVVPIDRARSSPVRISQVAFPSRKGTMYQWHPLVTQDPVVFWCCGPDPPPGPVFADGSVIAARWTDLLFAPDGYMEYWCGAPVASTWNGYLGVDR
jgi:hypothetical protein